jgi:hypothetical protein
VEAHSGTTGRSLSLRCMLFSLSYFFC